MVVMEKGLFFKKNVRSFNACLLFPLNHWSTQFRIKMIILFPALWYVWMEGHEGRVEERGGEDGWNILKFGTFHKPSHLLSSPLRPSPSVPNIPLGGRGRV